MWYLAIQMLLLSDLKVSGVWSFLFASRRLFEKKLTKVAVSLLCIISRLKANVSRWLGYTGKRRRPKSNSLKSQQKSLNFSIFTVIVVHKYRCVQIKVEFTKELCSITWLCVDQQVFLLCVARWYQNWFSGWFPVLSERAPATRGTAQRRSGRVRAGSSAPHTLTARSPLV